MNTEDRALLEAAARAAGIRGRWQEQPGRFVMVYDTGDDAGAWIPLEDDGDAFRLAVKLQLEIRPGHLTITACGNGVWEEVSINGDPYAATRRAIVRAAAAMAKEIP